MGRNSINRKFLQVTDWESEYKSVNKMLMYLKNEKSGSVATRTYACDVIGLFCRNINKNPDELLKMTKREIEREINHFLNRYSFKGSANTAKVSLKMFFRVNSIKKLDLPKFYVPSRGSRLTDEYVPKLEEAWEMVKCAGSLKAALVILFLFTTGLRNSTLRAIRYGVVKTKNLRLQNFSIKNELQEGNDVIPIIIDERMKEDVPNACKGRIPYIVFMPKVTTEMLKLYLNERERQYGRIEDTEFLFPTGDRRYKRQEKIHRPLTPNGIIKIVKAAARRAGIEQWDHITTHSLRKTFKETLEAQPKRLRLDGSDQEFFMGHLLPGARDNYYNGSNIEKLRGRFSKLIFTPSGLDEELQFLKGLAKFHDIDYNLIIKETEHRVEKKPSSDEIKAVLMEFIKKKNIGRQEIIDANFLEEYIRNDWRYVNTLPDGKVIVNKDVIAFEDYNSNDTPPSFQQVGENQKNSKSENNHMDDNLSITRKNCDSNYGHNNKDIREIQYYDETMEKIKNKKKSGKQLSLF